MQYFYFCSQLHHRIALLQLFPAASSQLVPFSYHAGAYRIQLTDQFFMRYAVFYYFLTKNNLFFRLERSHHDISQCFDQVCVFFFNMFYFAVFIYQLFCSRQKECFQPQILYDTLGIVIGRFVRPFSVFIQQTYLHKRSFSCSYVSLYLFTTFSAQAVSSAAPRSILNVCIL